MHRPVRIAAILTAAIVAGCVAPPPPVPRQPHMEETLRQLDIARHELEIADQFRDHGGHAGAATRLVEDAIHQVREGIRFRDEHGP